MIRAAELNSYLDRFAEVSNIVMDKAYIDYLQYASGMTAETILLKE
jgi:histidinol-phosphate/aromatic aminotransferase/cobyric acid decarboxylase-like protein